MTRSGFWLCIVFVIGCSVQTVENSSLNTLGANLPPPTQKGISPLYESEAEKDPKAKADALAITSTLPEVYGVTQPPPEGSRLVPEWASGAAILVAWNKGFESYFLELIGALAASHPTWVITADLDESESVSQRLTDAGAFLTDFNHPQSADSFHESLMTFIVIFPELLRRNHCEGAQRIIEVVHEYGRRAGDNEGLRKLLVRAINKLRDPENLDLCITLLEEAKPAEREHVRNILRFMGPAAVDRLLEILERHESRSVRKDCCTTLGTLGKGAAEKVLSSMSQVAGPGDSKPWYFTRNLCTVLGALRSPSTTPALVRAARHENVKVRLEALNALATTPDAATVAACLHALDDPQPQVQRRALLALGSAECSDPRLISKFTDWLELKTNKSDEAPVALQLAAIRTMQQLGNMPLEEHESTELLLAQLLRSAHRLSILRKLKGSHVEKDELVKVAACKALAVMGSSAVLDALTEAAADKSEKLSEAAEKALGAIRERLA
jgi:HEAT repeat protein